MLKNPQIVCVPWRSVAALSIAAALSTTALAATPAFAADNGRSAGSGTSMQQSSQDSQDAAMDTSSTAAAVDEAAGGQGSSAQGNSLGGSTQGESDVVVGSTISMQASKNGMAAPSAMHANNLAHAPSNESVSQVYTVGTGTSNDYQSLHEAVDALPGGTLKVTSDIRENTESIRIRGGKTFTIISDGAHTVTFSNGKRLYVEADDAGQAGTLILGDGNKANTLTIYDAHSDKSGTNTRALVYVRNGGTLYLRDGAKIDGSNNSGDAVTVGGPRASKSKEAHFFGEGGEVVSRLKIDESADGYIKGGTYSQNTSDTTQSTIRVQGHLSEISGGTSSLVVNGKLRLEDKGQVDTISGTAAAPVVIEHGVGNGISIGDGHIGTIAGNVTVTSHGDAHAAIWLDAEVPADGESSIDIIAGGTFIGLDTNDGLMNNGKIGSITGGTFRGARVGLANHGVITTIDGGSSRAVSISGTGSAGIGLLNGQRPNKVAYHGSIGTLKNAEITGVSYGLKNEDSIGSDDSGHDYIHTIGLIQNADISATGSDGIGLYNGLKSAITADIDASKVSGSVAGISNDGGTISNIKNSVFTGKAYGGRNEAADGMSAVVTIGGGNIFLATGEAGFGYYDGNETGASSHTVVEPTIKGSGKTSGTGRYWGAEGGMSGAGIIYPTKNDASSEVYHLSVVCDETLQKRVYKNDVEAYPDTYFQYLKLPYTLSYSANGGSGSMGSCAERSDGETMAVADNDFTRPGWYFAGWNTKADGTGTAYQPHNAAAKRLVVRRAPASGGDATEDSLMLGDDVTLYAQWLPYVLHYDKNADDATGAMEDSKPETSGSSVVVSSNGYARRGYEFAGWNTKADGTGETVAAGKLSEPLEADMTLYAQWKKVEEPNPDPKPDPKPAPTPKPAPSSPTKKGGSATNASRVAKATRQDRVVKTTPQTDDATNAALPAATGILGGLLAVFGLGARRREDELE